MKSMISKVFTWFNALGLDKYQHFSFGALIACLSALVTCWLPTWVMIVVSVLMVVVVAISKELYDDISDWVDFGATLCGGATVWIALFIV